MKHLETPLHLALAQKLYTETALNGGCSVNVNFEVPTEGYLVSTVPGMIFENISSVNEHYLSAFIKEELSLPGIMDWSGFYFGGCKDTVTGKLHFDLSAKFRFKDSAIAQAKKHNQIAIWDVANNCEIRL